jgi:hypothetical protein
MTPSERTSMSWHDGISCDVRRFPGGAQRRFVRPAICALTGYAEPTLERAAPVQSFPKVTPLIRSADTLAARSFVTRSRPVRRCTVSRCRCGCRSNAETTYFLTGSIDSLESPFQRTLSRRQVMGHTCFEAFVAPAGINGYYEFNFSPSTDWAVYRFSAYRRGWPSLRLLAHRRLPCAKAPVI